MKKKPLMNVYYKMCIFIGMGALLSLFLYLREFPTEMTGDIYKTFFSLDFDVSIEASIVVFNSVLIIFFVIFLINVGVLIFALIGEPLEGLVMEAAFYNAIITFLLLVSHLAFYLQIPSNINGEISHSIFHSNFYHLVDDKIIVFNFSYLFITVYIFFNAFIVYKFIPESKPKKGKRRR